MAKGGFVKLFGIGVAVLFILGLAPDASAGICSKNGYPIAGGYDCAFVQDPGVLLNCPKTIQYNCNNWPSKYQNGCVGYDYYDFSGSYASIPTYKSGGVCYHDGDYCYAQISYNDARCGYQPPYTPPAPTYSPPSPTSSPYYPPYTPAPEPTFPFIPQYPFCGNGVCELYENAFSCPFDCFIPPFPFLSSCQLTAYPNSVSAGQSVNIGINYFNTPYEPFSASVNCGNGQSAYAYGCYGYTGTCFASCYYPQSGNYRPTGFAGGVSCSATNVNVAGGNNGGGNGGSPTTPPIIIVPTPTPVPKYCAVSANPSSLIENGTSSITITYSGFSSAPSGNIVCGDGTSVSAACNGGATGSCTGSCTFTPSRLPAQFTVGATLNGLSCATAGVTVRKTDNPGFLTVRVVNQTLFPLPNAQVELQGTIQNTNVTGETSFTLPEGSYDVRASKAKYTTATGTARIVREKGTLLTLQLNELFDPSCGIGVSPGVIRGGQSALVTVDYADQNGVPSQIPVSCGNGQISSASCTGTPSKGACSASCFYPAEPDTQSFIVSASLSGRACGTSAVKVVKPLSSQGGLLAKVTSCTTGESLSGAEVRVFSPASLIPVNFTGDGTYDLTPGQKVRADNGQAVRFNGNSQGVSPTHDSLMLSTGSRSFPTSSTDTATVDLSYVRLSSGLAQPFNFGSAALSNLFYYITDSVPAGKGTQGLVFYQDPTTGNFLPYLHQNAEGTITYATGTTINGTGVNAVLTNATAQGCSGPQSQTLNSFSGLTLAQPITISGGTPAVNGYNLKSFTGQTLVSAQSVNASCTSGNYTLAFQSSQGSLGPGLGSATYGITYNYVEYNLGVPTLFEFNAGGISVGTTEPNAGNGQTLAITEYLDATNTSLGAYYFDVGFGDQSAPHLAPASGPALLNYNASYAQKVMAGTPQANGFVSPRGSNATVSLTSGRVDYALSLSQPTASVSFLDSQGNLLKTGQLVRGQADSTNDVFVRAVSLSGNTTALEVRSLTQNATPTTTFFTDAFGETFVQVAPGTYTVEGFKKDYEVTRSTLTVNQASNAILPICLKPARACDFSVELVSAPTCQVSSDQYQLRIANGVNLTKNLTLTYSTTEMEGPQAVVLSPNQVTLVNVRAKQATPAVSGQSLGVVSLSDGSNACTSAFTLPLCTAQEIILTIPQNRVSTSPGQSVCTEALVRNRALSNVQVTLTSSSNTASMRSEVSPDKVLLTPLEVKSVPVCATPPSGFSGTGTVFVKASSPFGEANATLEVSAFGQTFYSTDFTGCPLIDAARTTSYTLTVRNSAEDGDFTFDLERNPLTVQDRFTLAQFQKDTSRAVTLQLEPQDVKAGKVRFNAFLKKDGYAVMQQNLCFDIRGTSAVSAELGDSVLDVPRGQSRSTFNIVRNVGSLKSVYSFQVGSTPLNVRATPTQFTLSPGQEQVVDITVSTSQSQAASAYNVPLRISAAALSESPIAQHDVSVQCGNGQVAQVTCPGGTGSCTTTCTYGQEGIFTPSATVGGVSCNTASGTVRSIATTQNTCILHASPNSVDRGASLTVTASYTTLSSALNGTLSIDCGNGVRVNATNCNGNTGACSAACTYPAEGNFVVTANAGSVACLDARVAVANPAVQSCLLSSSPNTVVKGESSAITLRYNNLPVSGATGTSLPVPVLVDTENLLVNVVDSSSAITLSTAELVIEPVPPQQVFPGTAVNIPVTVRNDNYFTVESVLVYAQTLPPGVSSVPPAKFSLGPGEKKTVFIRAEASQNAQLGTRQIDLIAQSPLTREARARTYLSVLASSTSQLNVAVRITSSPLINGTTFILDLVVRNNEPVALTITPTLVLPQGWSYTVTPAQGSVGPSGEIAFQARVTAFNPQPGQEYPATMVLQSADGRTQRLPFTLTATGGDILAGFATLGDSVIGAGFAVFLLLIAVALFLFAAMNHFKRG